MLSKWDYIQPRVTIWGGEAEEKKQKRCEIGKKPYTKNIVQVGYMALCSASRELIRLHVACASPRVATGAVYILVSICILPVNHDLAHIPIKATFAFPSATSLSNQVEGANVSIVVCIHT